MSTASQPNTAQGVIPSPLETPSANIISVCAWCPELNILKLQRRDTDSLTIYQHGKTLRIMRNGVDLTISHSICDPCRAKHFPSGMGGTVGLDGDTQRDWSTDGPAWQKRALDAEAKLAAVQP